jgi:hypothetical protein
VILALVLSACPPLGLGIPLAGTNSVALSAACHSVSDDKDVSLKPLRYGVVEDVDGVCFSSKEVEP